MSSSLRNSVSSCWRVLIKGVSGHSTYIAIKHVPPYPTLDSQVFLSHLGLVPTESLNQRAMQPTAWPVTPAKRARDSAGISGSADLGTSAGLRENLSEMPTEPPLKRRRLDPPEATSSQQVFDFNANSVSSTQPTTEVLPSLPRYDDKQCPICGLWFRKIEYKTHLKFHGRHPFKCDICKDKFSRQSKLDKHRRIHFPTQPSCLKCSLATFLLRECPSEPKKKPALKRTRRGVVICATCGRIASLFIAAK